MTTTTKTTIADAIRTVTTAMQTAGGLERRITGQDVCDLLLAIADELDPEMKPMRPDAVPVGNAGCDFCLDSCNRPDEDFVCPYCEREWPIDVPAPSRGLPSADWIDCPKCGANDWDESFRDQPGEPIVCHRCGNHEFA